MGFSTAPAASWPQFTVTGTSLTLRANTDAGLVFVVGNMATSSSASLTLATLPAAFRPLATVQLTDMANRVFLVFAPDGQLTLPNGAAANTYSWRAFFFTTVIPG